MGAKEWEGESELVARHLSVAVAVEGAHQVGQPAAALAHVVAQLLDGAEGLHRCPPLTHVTTQRILILGLQVELDGALAQVGGDLHR